MSRLPKVLVATDKASDAQLIERMVQGEVELVSASTTDADAVSDFERALPDVLILAFDSLEKAERYYLGLFRLSTRIHEHRHRTVVLCNKDEVKRAFELCRKGLFDDYILFWPMTHDTPRLAMSVHHAWRELSAEGQSGPTVKDFGAQARRMDGLDAFLENNLMRVKDEIASARRSLGGADAPLHEALDSFSRKILNGDVPVAQVTDEARWREALARLKDSVLQHQQAVAAGAVQSVDQWVQQFWEEADPFVQSARALKSMVQELEPVVLIVEDDSLQRKILAKVLGSEPCELAFAETGMEALTMLKRLHPDLILMDLVLPDIDGVEVTRRVKSIPRLRSVPVVMITGKSDKDNVINSLSAGAVDFVVKPFERGLLLEKVKRFLQ
jgi:CheY-like chemotaxis protein